MSASRRPGRRHPVRSWAIHTAASVVGLVGCSQSEIKGTYDVEIDVAGALSPIHGQLILSTRSLDIPSLTDEERAVSSDWFESDMNDANSCFILEGVDPTLKNVRVFMARIHEGHVTLPLEIYTTPIQRIEIVRLQFFANAIGGDVILRDQGQQRPGRITGLRAGSPDSEKCQEDFESFRTMLRTTLGAKLAQ